MICVNHPTEPATHVARMPTATKQPDGTYREDVPLCEPCGIRIEAIGGFPVRRL